mmetsp:Transcript_14908/g.18176  ORF Transcript_14908/g.18176 Transcript_14908/m.18176 type:complete len:87 (-) Transcript_14908:253-513(-)
MTKPIGHIIQIKKKYEKHSELIKSCKSIIAKYGGLNNLRKKHNNYRKAQRKGHNLNDYKNDENVYRKYRRCITKIKKLEPQLYLKK